MTMVCSKKSVEFFVIPAIIFPTSKMMLELFRNTPERTVSMITSCVLTNTKILFE